MFTNLPQKSILFVQPPLRLKIIDSQKGLKKINLDIYITSYM